MDLDPSAAVTRPSTPLPKKNQPSPESGKFAGHPLHDMVLRTKRRTGKFAARFPDELAATMPSNPSAATCHTHPAARSWRIG